MPERFGGCDFPVRPSHKATEAHVFWLAEDNTGSVVLGAAPPIFPADDDVLRPIVEVAAITDGQGLHRLHDLGNGERLQLLQLAGAARGAPSVAFIPLGIEGFDRLEAIERLLTSLHGRVIPPDTRLTPQQLARARRMMQAFDGKQNGASQQEIAEVIFRIRRMTRAEWQAAPERYATGDLIRDALAMIEGGYRKLLRHRRRS